MRRWSDRPLEIAHLLNPAFCGEVLCETISGYTRECRNPLPFSLVFLILPVVLHEKTRETMPATTRIPMHDWLSKNPEVRIDFAERARHLVPIAKEALSFLMQLSAVTLDTEGVSSGLRAETHRNSGLEGAAAVALEPYFKKARHLGVWFARAGEPANVYTMWGIRP